MELSYEGSSAGGFRELRVIKANDIVGFKKTGAYSATFSVVTSNHVTAIKFDNEGGLYSCQDQKSKHGSSFIHKLSFPIPKDREDVREFLQRHAYPVPLVVVFIDHHDKQHLLSSPDYPALLQANLNIQAPSVNSYSFVFSALSKNRSLYTLEANTQPSGGIGAMKIGTTFIVS